MKRVFTLRILPLLLVLCCLLTAAGCKSAYKPIPSTSKEAREVMKVGDYSIRYELFRAFFYTYKSAVDGGDETVWTDDGAEEYWAELVDRIVTAACNVYAPLALCEKHGLDTDSKEVRTRVNDYVKADIDGGFINGTWVEGYGSRDTYVKELKKLYLNDSVCRLLYRSNVCENMIQDRLTDVFQGVYTYTEEDVRAFYAGEDVRHVRWIFRSAYSGLPEAESYQRMEQALRRLSETNDETEVKRIIAQYSTDISDADIERGFYVSRNTLDSDYYEKVTAACFSLSPGQTSGIIETSEGLYIVMVCEKDPALLEDAAEYEAMVDLYLEDRFNRDLKQAAAELKASLTYDDFFYTLNCFNIDWD